MQNRPTITSLPLWLVAVLTLTAALALAGGLAVHAQAPAPAPAPPPPHVEQMPPPAAATMIADEVAVVALLLGLALAGLASLAQAAAVRSLERTYRRHKVRELERASARDLAARREQLHERLARDPHAWREVVQQLLVDARVGHDTVLADAVEVSVEPCPHFAVAGNGWRYLFTADPQRLRRRWPLRQRDRAIPLDAALSPFARIEVQALWDHLAQELAGERTTLPRDAAWYLVVRRTSDWRPRARRKKRRKRRGLANHAVAPPHSGSWPRRKR